MRRVSGIFTFAQRGSLRQAVKKLGVQAGAYVLKMQAGRNTETETIIVR